MLAYWLNKLFGYDYVEDKTGLVARVYFDKSKLLPFYYSTTGLAVYIKNPSQINWLTCDAGKYFSQEL